MSWTGVRFFQPQFDSVYDGWVLGVDDHSFTGSNHIPLVTDTGPPATDDINYTYQFHTFTHLTDPYEAPKEGPGYFATEQKLNSVISLGTVAGTHGLPYNGGYIGGMAENSHENRTSLILDFNPYRFENIQPYDDPDYSNALDIEWLGEATYVSAVLHITAISIGGSSFFDPVTLAGGSNDALIPAIDFSLYRLPSYAYDNTKTGGWTTFRPIQGLRDETSIYTALTPLQTWAGAQAGDTPITVMFYPRGTIAKYRSEETYNVGALDVSHAAVYAINNSAYLNGAIPDPGAYNEYYSWLYINDNVFDNSSGRPYFELTWIPRPYRLLLPGIPPLRFNQRDDHLGIENASARLNVPGLGINQTASIQQARSPRIGETGGGSNRYL